MAFPRFLDLAHLRLDVLQHPIESGGESVNLVVRGNRLLTASHISLEVVVPKIDHGRRKLIERPYNKA